MSYTRKCSKCGQIKSYSRFSPRGKYSLNSWCKDCVNSHAKKRTKLEKSMDAIIERASKGEARKSLIAYQWEKAKEENKRKCEERKKAYEKFQEKLMKLPKEIRQQVETRGHKPCAVCNERKTWPYEIGAEWIWLCKEHKIKKKKLDN